MKTCRICGEMISPYPMHREVQGSCDVCMPSIGESLEPTDSGRPKKVGSHLKFENRRVCPFCKGFKVRKLKTPKWDRVSPEWRCEDCHEDIPKHKTRGW